MELILDTKIRDWVFLPLCAVMLFSGLLKILLNELVSQSSIQQLTEEDIRANQVLSRTARWKSYYKFVPQNAFKQRRALFCRKEDGIFAFKFEDLSNSPMAMMMDPTKMLSGMKKNMVMTISSIFTITWVSHFLSGFIAGKLPFALSERFRTMLQRGVELKALDVTYVSSLSWCFLMLFALGNVYKLILSEDKSDYSQMALLGMPPMMMAGGQQGRDNNKLFQSEKETFEMIQYSWGIDNADEKLLAKIKEDN